LKQTFNFIIIFIVLGALWGSALAGQGVGLDPPEMSTDAEEKQGGVLLYPIRFFQDYISRADGDRCPMHPTCSQYCSEAFKKHGALLGWIMCSDRLIRCGRDETRLSDPVWIDGVKHSFDPLSHNDFWRK
jgi:putative component of membrane protein insertase Oxa1/YidC/SpoIIIJ protein YidD